MSSFRFDLIWFWCSTNNVSFLEKSSVECKPDGPGQREHRRRRNSEATLETQPRDLRPPGVDSSPTRFWIGSDVIWGSFCEFGFQNLTIFALMLAFILWNGGWNVQIARSEWGCQKVALQQLVPSPCRNSRNTTFSMRWLASGFQDQRRSPSTSRSPSRSPAWWTSATTHLTSTRATSRWHSSFLSSSSENVSVSYNFPLP